jgi:hypothetical protein
MQDPVEDPAKEREEQQQKDQGELEGLLIVAHQEVKGRGKADEAQKAGDPVQMGVLEDHEDEEGYLQKDQQNDKKAAAQQMLEAVKDSFDFHGTPFLCAW